MVLLDALPFVFAAPRGCGIVVVTLRAQLLLVTLGELTANDVIVLTVAAAATRAGRFVEIDVTQSGSVDRRVLDVGEGFAGRNGRRYETLPTDYGLGTARTDGSEYELGS